MPKDAPKQQQRIEQIVLGSLDAAFTANMAFYSLGVGFRRGLVQALLGESHPIAQSTISWSKAVFPLMCYAALAPWYGGMDLLREAYFPPEKPSKVD